MLIYLQAETKSCYKEAGKRPLIEKMNGGTEYTVKQKYLDVAKSNGVTVVVTSGEYTLVNQTMIKLFYELFC